MAQSLCIRAGRRCFYYAEVIDFTTNVGGVGYSAGAASRNIVGPAMRARLGVDNQGERVLIKIVAPYTGGNRLVVGSRATPTTRLPTPRLQPDGSTVNYGGRARSRQAGDALRTPQRSGVPLPVVNRPRAATTTSGTWPAGIATSSIGLMVLPHPRDPDAETANPTRPGGPS
jgi:hypothetical protein